MTDPTGTWAARRGRVVAVLAILLGAAVCLIGSTQPWATAEVAGAEIAASGAEAAPLLQPLSLAGLAASLALTLTGRVARLILAGVSLAIGAGLGSLGAFVFFGAPISAVQTVVTEHTGLAGAQAATDAVDGLAVTAWPLAAVVAGLVVACGAIVALATGARWRTGGRRFRGAEAAGSAREAGPLDAIDSWDDLSRGGDPTRPGD